MVLGRVSRQASEVGVTMLAVEWPKFGHARLDGLAVRADGEAGKIATKPLADSMAAATPAGISSAR
jgi:molybdopterin biosynthesis enzyme